MQATARLKVLLTQAGINFTVDIFNTEEGIAGLGLQPFVSSCIPALLTQFMHSNLHAITSHFTYTITIVGPPVKDFYNYFIF